MATKRKDGRYQLSVVITDPLTGEKKRHYAYGYTEEEARRELERIKRNDGDVSLSAIKFSRWAQEWLKIKKSEVSESSYWQYKRVIERYFTAKLNDMQMRRITPAIVRNLIYGIQGRKMKNLSFVLLNNIFEQAVKEDIIQRNPCMAVTAPRYTLPEKAIITPDMLKLILRNLDDQMQRMFYLAYLTGLRRGELIALEWGDIDLKNKSMHISRSVKLVNSKYMIGKTKTASSVRTLLLSRLEIDVLKEQMDFQRAFCDRMGYRFSERNFVFTSIRRYPNFISPNFISTKFVQIKQKEHLHGISFHSFRHTHATMLLEAGIPIKAVQERLGHSSVSTTLSIYAHNTERMQEQIAHFVDSIGKETDIKS